YILSLFHTYLTRSILLLCFIYCYRHHRDLHSFPTRRSSDLMAIALFSSLRRSARRKKSSNFRSGRSRFRNQRRGRSTQTSISFTDRKSTRLNSSHGSISYAVFCLKKKKKQKNINTEADK